MFKGLRGRDLLTLRDYTPEEINGIIDLADELKVELDATERHVKLPLGGKSIVMFFEKQSLRTRVSFEAGIHQLGGQVIYLNSNQTHSNRGEPLRDTAMVLDRYAHGLVFRAYRHSDIVEMANNMKAPVINALCDRAHPCQALADLQTIYAKLGRGGGYRVAYVGDGNNVAASLAVVLSKVGVNASFAFPEGYQLDDELMADVKGWAATSGADIFVTTDPFEAVQGADIVYTDVWVSMGMEEEEESRRKAFDGYIVTNKLMAAANAGALFMHDLPAHRGEEVASEVIDGPQSIIYDQAENRLHAQKAVMTLLIGD